MNPLKKRLTSALSDGGSFRRKIITSAALSTLVFVVHLITRIVSTIVLTRILTPDVFGVFAVVMTFIYIFEQFSDISVRALILTKEGELDDDFLRSCWTAQILRGLLIFLLCCCVAFGIKLGQDAGWFPAESSYAVGVLPYAIACIGIASIITGFASTSRFVYERNMNFRQISIENLIRAVVSLTITITLAFWLRSIWALVYAFLIGAVIQVIFSFALYAGPAMRLNWDRTNLKLIIDRGKWIAGQSGLTAILLVADRFVLGFAMSASSFGFYYVARQIVDLVEMFLSSVHAQMGLQVFTELQKHEEASVWRRQYYRYRLLFDGLSMLGAGGLMTFAPTLVGIVYDDRYAEIAPIIQILAVGMILVGPGLLREAFVAERRLKEMTKLSLVRAVTVWSGLLIAVFGFGSITGGLVVIALHRIPEIGFLLTKGRREQWVSLLNEIRLLPAVPLGAAMGWGMAQLLQGFV
ncbi:oligosaccharide flippase family protein [Loktanella sp. Alg231-35]|uniref:oligosaccharide flippase family protein n=1 Tax=Loktanella sp. Alg231-35 TaxID=1922220 RepID=UPI000D561892|nr:oligosaccharide flippase family protein [Loktanella sp. Alg231-35]